MTGVARLVFGNRLYVIYDCVDYFSLANPDEESKLRINEMKLLKHADLVVANSSVLANFHKKIRQDIQVVPLGFKLDEMAILPQKQDAPLVKKKFKTIGFIGAINYRIDFDLLTVLAKNNPHWKFVFIGPIYISDWDRKLATSRKITTLFSLSNVVLEKFSKSQKIYQEMADWSAAIIPYDLSLPLNQYCYPMKLMEYFYLGLPIVSVRSEEHTSELQSPDHLVCRLLLEKKKKVKNRHGLGYVVGTHPNDCELPERIGPPLTHHNHEG